MRVHVERDLFAQTVDEAGAVLVQEGHEADLTFLRVSARKGESPGMVILASQGVVLALCGLNDLAVQLLQIVLHARQRRTGGAFQCGIDLRDLSLIHISEPTRLLSISY